MIAKILLPQSFFNNQRREGANSIRGLAQSAAVTDLLCINNFERVVHDSVNSC